MCMCSKRRSAGNFKRRAQREEIRELGAGQIGVDGIVALVVAREDRVGAMGAAQVGIEDLPQRFEVIVAVVLEERRDHLI